MIVDDGLEQVRDAVLALCTKGEAGTDNTTPAATQTDLIAGVAATNTTTTTTAGVASFQVTHTISSAVGTGNNFKEWGIFTTGNVLISRAVTAGVNHTANDEITKITTFNILDR